jgi:hypothetical protein
MGARQLQGIGPCLGICQNRTLDPHQKAELNKLLPLDPYWGLCPQSPPMCPPKPNSWIRPCITTRAKCLTSDGLYFGMLNIALKF